MSRKKKSKSTVNHSTINMERSATFPLSILSQLSNRKKDAEFIVVDGIKIRSDSQRYAVFKKSVKCCHCGIEGTFFAAEKSKACNPQHYHLNLYGLNADGEEVLFTKDHILPKSKGGENVIKNYQTMCTVCNGKKGNNI